jgi:hypothetical protein
VRPVSEARAWTPPQGHADIAPTRFERIEGDGYLTLDAPWIVPALLRLVPIEGRALEPAAGRGHLSLALRRAGLDVTSFDCRRYADPLVPNIGIGDIRERTTLEGFAWVVTNLPYEALEELATHLIDLGARDRCGVALLARAEWIVPKARRKLVHEHPHFAGAAMLTARPRWVERAQDKAHQAKLCRGERLAGPCRRWRSATASTPICYSPGGVRMEEPTQSVGGSRSAPASRSRARLAHRHKPDAGHDLALGQMPAPHDAPAAAVGFP